MKKMLIMPLCLLALMACTNNGKQVDRNIKKEQL